MKSTKFANEVYKIILSSVVTEKSTSLSEGVISANGVCFMFNVATFATKPQIKKAIEKIFNVTVVKVRIANIKGKLRTLRHRRGGKRPGFKPLRKRAYIRLKDGDNIDFWDFKQE